MTRGEITALNLGQSLDDLANLDPRGYGVCKILYEASRKYTGQPLAMNAAGRLARTVKENSVVYVMTGFVLAPYKKAETDGMISSVLLCRSLVRAFGARPVIVCPQDCLLAVEKLADCVGLTLCTDIDRLAQVPNAMGVVCFTKDSEAAEAQADAMIKKAMPDAVISIECPGANSLGVYHNATGLNVTELEAKQDVLFERLCELGVLNIAIGDLGNEIGMGAIAEALERHVPYARAGACRCGCGGGIVAKTKADAIVTATVSDWGCYAMIAALAYLMGDADIMHSADDEREMLITGAKAGLIDMYGEHIPAIDGFSLELNLAVVSMMRELVLSTLSHATRCTDWFDQVAKLGYFDK